jgi:hypothetical protein
VNYRKSLKRSWPKKRPAGKPARGKHLINGQELPIYNEEKIKRDPLEKNIEAKVRAYAIKLGCYVRKFSSPGNRSVPDRIILTPNGVTGYLEMKRRGKKPTPGQADEIDLIKAHKAPVTWADNFEDGKAFVDELMRLDAIKEMHDLLDSLY